MSLTEDDTLGQPAQYTRILSSLSHSTRLHHLSISFGPLEFPDDLIDELLGDAADWQPLDQVLTQNHFTDLKTVTVNILVNAGHSHRDTDEANACKAGIAKRLPLLYNRGTLEVNVGLQRSEVGEPSIEKSKINAFVAV